VHPGKRGAHAPVPLVRHEHDGAGLGDAEVRARDAHVRRHEDVAEPPPGDLRERLELRLDPLPLDPREELRHVLLRLLDRGRDDVDRVLARELEDVLAQVGLHRPDPGRLEGGVKPDLLARHRLALRDELRADALADREDVVVRVVGRRGEVDVAAVRGDRLPELFQVVVELGDRPGSDLAAALPQRLDVFEHRPGARAV
jgi:hypothetical protein